ncbi:MAG: hypothetical protein AB1652_08580 [Bacillota bacterium]
MRFRFSKLELKKLSWREYVHRDNPVAAALLSKMGFAEEEQLYQELGRIDQKGAELIMQITTSWHEKGKIEGKIEDICKFMVRRFNADAGEVMEKIQRVASLEILDGIMEEVFAANTLEEAQSIIRRAVGKSLQ